MATYTYSAVSCHLPYGKTHLELRLPDRLETQFLTPADVPSAPDPIGAVVRALELSPISAVLSSHPRSAAVAVSDKTRPVPHAHLLPPLLAHLEALGLKPEAITILIGAGTHAPMTSAEFGQVIPVEVLERYRVLCHDGADRASLAYLGETSHGTPVWVNRLFIEADLRIVVGDIEPHQFAGFSGGVKTAAIGLAGIETINRNHALMMDPRSRIARYADNPVRQDIEEIGRLAGVHYALNAVLNADRRIVHVLAGDPTQVMAQGIPLAMPIFRVDVDVPFDLMIVSPGGHPKDINFVQAQKALGHAAPVTRTGGSVILVAACPEGTGSTSYEAWMAAAARANMTSYEAVLARFRREEFRVGPHKAFQVARDGMRVRLFLLSEMPAGLVRRLLLTPIADLADALAQMTPGLPAGARVGVMPLANTTIPMLTLNQ